MQKRLQFNGLPALMLVVVIFWALSAVLMLTSTLGSANRIDERVKVINSDVAPIDEELDTVPILVEISQTASDIRAAAAPLTGGLENVVDDVGTIDASAKTILVSASEINGKVKEINGSVNEINTSVNSIGPAVFAIEDTALGINDTVDSINGKFVAVTGLVLDIQDNLVNISGQVDTLNGQIVQLKEDTGTISPIVDEINAHAAAIRASPVILDSANASVMHQAIMASTLAPSGTAGVPAIGDLLPQLQGLLGPLPSVQLDEPLPLLGLSLLESPLLSDTGGLLSLVVPQ